MSELKLKLLVVDYEDSEFLRSSVSLFDVAGFNVDFCSDWDAMQRKLKHSVRTTDVLIIDITCFQDRDSYLLLMELRGKEYSKDLKIVLTTDTLVEELLLRTRRELGIVASFNKKRPVEELLYVLTNILPPGGENLRRSRRIPARFLVHSTVEGRTKVLCARNLSRGGIFVENHIPDPVGTAVELSFTLPGKSSELVIKARVARATAGSHVAKQEVFPAGNGFEFVDVSDVDDGLLKEFLEHEELRIFGPDEEPSSPQESKDPMNIGCISEAEL